MKPGSRGSRVCMCVDEGGVTRVVCTGLPAISVKARLSATMSVDSPPPTMDVLALLSWPPLIGSLMLITLTSWVFFTKIHPPPPKKFAVTAPRVRLRDGRHLAYKVMGVPKETATYKIIFIHGVGGCRHSLPVISQSFLEEHGVFIVGFDRAGYGESDPHPTRNLKSAADDVKQLADLLDLGSKFYILAQSIGAYTAWSCLKYIPQRLAGAGLVSPVVNFWWRGVSGEEFKQAFATQVAADRWFLRATHYLPWLCYWWLTQKCFPGPTGPRLRSRPDLLCPSDRECMKIQLLINKPEINAQVCQQGVAESICRDVKVMFSDWEFDPSDIQNPYSNDSSRVCIWQGDEDYVIPIVLQRYIHRKMPWIKYNELRGEGHYMSRRKGFWDNILRSFLLEENVEFETFLI